MVKVCVCACKCVCNCINYCMHKNKRQWEQPCCCSHLCDPLSTTSCEFSGNSSRLFVGLGLPGPKQQNPLVRAASRPALIHPHNPPKRWEKDKDKHGNVTHGQLKALHQKKKEKKPPLKPQKASILLELVFWWLWCVCGPHTTNVHCNSTANHAEPSPC